MLCQGLTLGSLFCIALQVDKLIRMSFRKGLKGSNDNFLKTRVMTMNILRNKASSLMVRMGITVLLIGYVLGRVDLSSVIIRVSRMALDWLLIALLVVLFQVVLVTLRWQRIIQVIQGPFSFLNALSLELMGLFFSQSLPTSIGGDPLRIWYLFKQGVPAIKAANSVFLDRVSALIATLSLIAVSLPVISRLVPGDAMIAALGAGVAVLLAGVLLLPRLSVLIRLLPECRATSFLGAVADDSRKVFGCHRPSLETFFLSGLVQVLIGVTVFLIARGLDIAVGLIPCLVMMPPVMILSMLPISIAGWGVREVAMLKAFEYVGVLPDDALAMSVVFGTLNLVVGLLGGLVWSCYLSNRGAASPAQALVERG
jgi:glycosyltransferase 2 family protein